MPRPIRELLRLLLCCLPAAVMAQPAAEVPAETALRWEAGVAVLGLRTPDYPAADEIRSLVLPAPYFVYRGRVLRADEQGSRLRRRLTPQAELSFSAGGALSSDSEGSAAREGMPDLDYLVELGPKLRLSFDTVGTRAQVLLDLPLRGVVSIGDGGLGWRGVVLAPELIWQERRLLGGPTSLRVSLAADYASTLLQRYFYEVSDRHVTASRPAYEAQAGYLGATLGLGLSRPLGPRMRGFAAVRYHRHDGAANQDSPLFRSEDGFAAILGLSWTFLRSRQPALAD